MLLSDSAYYDVRGPAERWVQTLASLHAGSQMNAFVFWPSGDRERQSRLFAEQVVPAARRAIADSVSPGLPRK